MGEDGEVVEMAGDDQGVVGAADERKFRAHAGQGPVMLQVNGSKVMKADPNPVCITQLVSTTARTGRSVKAVWLTEATWQLSLSRSASCR